MECRLSASVQALEPVLMPLLYYLLAHGQA